MGEKAQASKDSLNYVDTPRYPQPPESFTEKIIRKTKENPLVPIGLIATVVVLGSGIYSMKTGDRAKSQRMMRYRVLFQGFTVAALVGGVMWSQRKTTKD